MCKDKEATVHLTQVVDGEVRKVHLCDECAGKSGFDIDGPVSITDILLGMGGEQAPAPAQPSERVCPTCGMGRAEFKKTGRLGCPDCYEAFEDELSSLIKAMHRSERHAGKIPSREGIRVRMSAEIASLQKELQAAVTSEQFEEAARIRDRIQACKDELKKEETRKAAS